MEDRARKEKELELLLLEKERRTRQDSPQNQPEDNRGLLDKFVTASGIPGANRAFAKTFSFDKGLKDSLENTYQEALKTNPKANKAAGFAADVYGSIPFFMAGGGAAKGAAKAIPALAKSPYLTKILGGMFGAGAHSGAKDVEEGETRLGNIAKGATIGGAVDAILPGFGKAYNYLKPSSYVARKFGKAIPQAEILENARIAQGTQTPLGDVLGSAPLKKSFENEIAPLSGEVADNAFAKSSEQVTQKGKDLLGSISKSKNAKTDANYELEDILKSAYKKQRSGKNKLYDQASEIAEKEKFNLELPTFSKLAKETVNSIENSPLLKYDSSAKKIFNKIVNYQNPTKKVESIIVDKAGKPLISKTLYPKIKDANYLANKFESAAETASNSPNAEDRAVAGLYKNFAGKLRKDVESQVSKKGSEALKESVGTAKQNYKDNFTPFLDKDIFKLTQGTKDAETLINDVIRPGGKDRFKRIEKIQNLLPENKKGLLGHEYLRGAYNKDGLFDPNKFSSLVGKLGKRQTQALFPDKAVQKQLSDYQKLTQMNNEAIYRMLNLRTGQRNITPLNSILKTGAAVAGSIAGGGAGLPGQIAGAATGHAIPKIFSKKFAKDFTSEAYRQLVIDKIMGLPAKQKYSPIKDILGNALKVGLSRSNSKDGQ